MALPFIAFFFFFLACRVSAGSCASKPCGTDYKVTSWNPIREGAYNVYYYEVKADGCGVVFTDVLLQTSMSCKDCATIKCYDSNWNVVRCPVTPTWINSDSFLNSKGVSVSSGLKWVTPRRTTLRFSLSVNPQTTTSAQGKLYTKGNSWTYCRVITPVCNCGCPPCPSRCYKPNHNDCTCRNCTDCIGQTYETSPCTTTSNRICEPCRICVPNATYEVVPCTPTNNRVCENCAICVANMTYETRACNGTRNRICTPCSNCLTNFTYETSACTPTQNRVCTNCRQCVTNMTYQTVPCSGTTNRVCQNCTQCVTNTTYEAVSCTTMRDRVCQDCTVCVNNMTYQTVPCGPRNDRVCQNCTQCVTNMTFETRPCNTTTNRVCQDCTRCVTNSTYETVPCLGNTDRVCSNCSLCVANATYETRPCNVTNDRVCTDCSVCLTNMTYETVPCTTTSNRICNNCTTCIPGVTYENRTCDLLSDRICDECTICLEGFFEAVPCNVTDDRVCQQCSNCSANEQVLFPCNATHDVVCEPCPLCANCTDPNSHLSNNGLNCTCNEGYSQDPFSEEFACVPTPCCQDCQSCGFNASVACFAHDPTLCDYSCLRASECTLGNTPFDTGYTIEYNGLTQDAACCGAGNGECTCFSYQIGAASPVIPLDDFILGLTCEGLQQCSEFSAPPCLDSVQRDGTALTSGVFITDESFRNPYTGLFGIVVTGLGLNQDATVLTFVFQGAVNESSLPITYSASSQSPTSEDRSCLIDSITGPNCLDCSTNPFRVQKVRKTLMSSTVQNADMSFDNSANANQNVVVAIGLTIVNIVALMGAARN